MKSILCLLSLGLLSMITLADDPKAKMDGRGNAPRGLWPVMSFPMRLLNQSS